MVSGIAGEINSSQHPLARMTVKGQKKHRAPDDASMEMGKSGKSGTNRGLGSFSLYHSYLSLSVLCSALES